MKLEITLKTELESINILLNRIKKQGLKNINFQTISTMHTKMYHYQELLETLSEEKD